MGSEMCIRDRIVILNEKRKRAKIVRLFPHSDEYNALAGNVFLADFFGGINIWRKMSGQGALLPYDSEKRV